MGLSSRSAVVIGGGITGSLTALELRDAGWHVNLLEQGGMGHGSSSRTAGGIRRQFTTQGTVLAMRYAVTGYLSFQRRLAAFTDEPDTRVIRQNGYLFLEGRKTWEKAQERVRLQKEWGLDDVEALDLKQIKERFPYVRPNRGLIKGATWCPSDGFLYPSEIYNGARKLAEAAGAVFHQNTPVIGAEHAGGRLVSVKTPNGNFEGDIFIDATNAWTNRLAAILGGEVLTLQVDPLKRHLWLASRRGSMPPDVLATLPLVIGPTGVYCRPEGSGQLLYAKLPKRTKPQPNFTDEDQDKTDRQADHRSSNRYQRPWLELAALIPAIGEFEPPSVTAAGFYGSSPDHNPFFGFDPLVANLLRLVGFSGHGAMMGPFSALVALKLAEAGINISDLLLPGGARVSLAPFAIGREFVSHEGLVI